MGSDGMGWDGQGRDSPGQIPTFIKEQAHGFGILEPRFWVSREQNGENYATWLGRYP